MHQASLNDLKNSNMIFKIYRLGASPSSQRQLYSTYQVDLLTVAIGPVHQSIALVLASGRNDHCGKMSCNISFTQVQNAMVKLLNLQAEIADPEAHVTKSRMYNVKFSVITFNEVFESVRSESRPPLPQQSKPNSPDMK